MLPFCFRQDEYVAAIPPPIPTLTQRFSPLGRRSSVEWVRNLTTLTDKMFTIAMKALKVEIFGFHLGRVAALGSLFSDKFPYCFMGGSQLKPCHFTQYPFWGDSQYVWYDVESKWTLFHLVLHSAAAAAAAAAFPGMREQFYRVLLGARLVPADESGQPTNAFSSNLELVKVRGQDILESWRVWCACTSAAYARVRPLGSLFSQRVNCCS